MGSKKRKRINLNLNINITNRWLYAIIALVILLVLGIGVWAYNTNSPITMGHTMGELTGITCNAAAGQVLQWTGTSWTCATVTVSGGGTLPTCSSGQVLKSIGSGWTCGTWSCTTATGSFSSSSIATCASGYTLTGGGCITDTGISPNIYITAPSGNGWQCQLSGGNRVTAYARCCSII